MRESSTEAEVYLDYTQLKNKMAQRMKEASKTKAGRLSKPTFICRVTMGMSPVLPGISLRNAGEAPIEMERDGGSITFRRADT